MTQYIPHTNSTPSFEVPQSTEDKQSEIFLRDLDCRLPLIIHRPPSNEQEAMGRTKNENLIDFNLGRRNSDHICPKVARNLPKRAQSARYKFNPRLVATPTGNLLSLPTKSGSSLQRSHSARVKRSDGDACMRERTGSFPSRPSVRKTSNGTVWDKPKVNTVEARFLALPESQDFERLRNFSVERGHIINRGDSFRRKREDGSRGESASSGSNPSRRSSGGTPVSPRTSVSPRNNSLSGEPSGERFTVMVIGAPATGKSSLVIQFASSEYCNPFENDDVETTTDFSESTVCVLLGQLESQMTFIEVEYSQKNDLWQTVDCDAYIVMFAVDNRNSFNDAKAILERVRPTADLRHKPVVLAGNKMDLARKLNVARHESESLAKAYECTFVEVSVVLNHNVDELLVGVLSATRKHQRRLSDSAFQTESEALLEATGGHLPLRPVKSAADSIASTAKKKFFSCFGFGSENLAS